MDWKSVICQQLETRNARETVSFQNLINFYNKLYDSSLLLRAQNVQLESQIIRGNTNGDLMLAEKISVLEQKLLVQQEELTELHRRRGENAQMIIDLNAKLQLAEQTITSKNNSLTEHIKTVASLRAEISLYQKNNSELKQLNQILKDEHQALQLAFTKLEEKLRKSQDENRELVDRLMTYKSKDADKLNEENDHLVRRRNDKMQKELKEAVKDTRGVPAEYLTTVVRDSVGPIIATSSAMPTKASIRFDAHDGVVSAVKWSPVDRMVATGGEDRKVKLWDVSKGVAECKGMLIGSNAGVMSVEFDSTGAQIIAASNDLASRVWTVNDQRLRHTLTGHCAKVMAAKFMGEPSKVVTGSHDRTLKIYDLRARACVETKFAGSSCNDLVTSETIGTTIMSGHFDKRIRFWDTRTETPHTDIEVQGRVTSLDLSRDCNYLLSCVRDDTLRLIDLRTNKIITTFETDGFKVGCDWTRAVFNFEYDHVSVGSSDGSVFIWEVANPTKPLVVLRDEHGTPVTAVSWHQYTNNVASVDRSRKAVVWSDV
ncbi:Six-bladed beta-propeller, TolB-like,WD40-repeat-containing domain,WD40 repeat, conserved site,WD40/YVTN [Cinara cedri]|uniref:Six-bladed beta-propeller, TolB-like,WD40-repeat-containing domain,WD40 repeat, conserved site,WD40/YVTN n=1 Tax=Cinara cedri TaxID=506608 RepID=A0A5E4MWP5_9HEMI|nr:Six-bladed beta-propeller, TolB-like,WD40-repeat-containing domain,WD40 repeat, conserved site,WD40/YVTN [Cinara cedri]